jgi:hypothetical protein
MILLKSNMARLVSLLGQGFRANCRSVGDAPITGGDVMKLSHGVPLETNLLLYMCSRILRSFVAVFREGKRGPMAFKTSVGEHSYRH